MRIAAASFRLALASLAAALVGAGCGVAGTVVADDLALVLPDDATCRPDAVTLVRLSALGDFPTTDRTVTLFDARIGERTIPDFPFATAVLAADTEATISGSPVAFSGARLLGPADLMGRLMLLPLDRSCALADRTLVPLEGQPVVALPDGAALFVGGLRESAEAQVLRLDPGVTTAMQLASTDGLAVPRAGATATLSGSWVVVAAGSVVGLAAGALGTIELYDVARGRFDHEAAVGLTLMRKRAYAGAGALADGRVLVVGGIDETGHALGEAELIDLDRHRVDGPAFLTGATQNLIDPWVGSLDDGTLLVVGGDTIPPTSGVRGPSGAILVFSAADLAFAPYGTAVAFTPLASASVVPLPGERLAYVGLGPTGTLAVEVLYASGAPYVDVVDVGPAPTMMRAVAAALPDGRILVEGTAPPGTTAAAYVVDLSLDTVTQAMAKVRATALAPLADGTLLELSPEGASLRRPSALGGFGNPGMLLPGGTIEGVALDDGSHWQTTGGLLVAQRTAGGDARLEVPTLRFGDARITLRASGDVTLILGSARVSPKRIAITDTDVMLAGCGLGAVPRVAGADVVIERRGDTLAISAGGAAHTCTTTFGGERFTVGISAAEGAGVANLRVERLAPAPR